MRLRDLLAPFLGAARTPLPIERRWHQLFPELAPNTLSEVLEKGTLHPHFSYQRLIKRKKSGGQRELFEPDLSLKYIQHKIIETHFSNAQVHPSAIAYRKGRSIADHAWAHAGAETFVACDVLDFFTNTKTHRIERWWRGLVDDNSARLFTLLTTHHGGLPQGAPTSPGLSNFVNLELDTRLAQRAEAAGARFTRYCDDMVFSWRSGGPSSSFEGHVRGLLQEFGYRVQPTKGWAEYQRSDEPEITGVVLTKQGRVRLPQKMREAMRALERSDDPLDAERLRGYAAYASMIKKSRR